MQERSKNDQPSSYCRNMELKKYVDLIYMSTINNYFLNYLKTTPWTSSLTQRANNKMLHNKHEIESANFLIFKTVFFR